ncbi:MAG: BamA/TamA family outer membrane protein [bacterium]|nr:BamA/TamA family outer membrane protein [bacterium]
MSKTENNRRREVKSSVSRSDRVWCASIAVCTAILCVSSFSFAEQAEEAIEKIADQTEAAAEALGGKRFFVMPVPIHNPTIGTGLGLMTMSLFQAGENAPPSNLMLGGFWADSNSWAGGAGGMVHFKDDTYRLSGWVGFFDVNLQFYGIGNEAGDRGESVEINQSGPFFMPRLLRRVKGNFYLGAQFRYMKVKTGFTNLPDWLPGDILERGVTITSSGLGLIGEYDGRDNEFGPSTGSYLLVTSNFAREELGSDRDYELYDVGFNLYRTVGEGKVLAWRTTGCMTGGATPFYDLCLVGGEVDGIRGYVGGQYRDEVSVTTQLEYRWNFHKKWGMVAFGGVGQIGPSFSEISSDNLLPSYGVGIRFMASKEQGVNLGIDYARGKDSGAWYFRIAEAF